MTERSNSQSSFSDLVTADLGGPRTTALLARLEAAVPWKPLADRIRKLPEYARYIADPSLPGTRPINPEVMLRSVMLAKWFNLSDPQLEEQLQDRISFRRFARLGQDDKTPDETTFVTFRDRLREAKLDEVIFADIVRHIEHRGLLIKKGTIVDATILEQSRGHKTGEQDKDGNDLTTRDPEAGFTQKNGQKHHGYKLHAATDLSGIVTKVVASSASDHDSTHMDELVKEERIAVLGDSAYGGEEGRLKLRRRGVMDAICEKRVRGQTDLEPWQQRWNKIVSPVRAIGEHPFAWIKRLMNFRRCRYRGLRRNAFDFLMTVTAYNIKKSVSLAG